MRLRRTANIGMLRDGLDLEDDDGTITPIATPQAGYFSASGYSSKDDVVFGWSARLHGGPAGLVVVLETSERDGDGERTGTVCYARQVDGTFAIVAPAPILAGAPLLSEAAG